MYYVSRIAGAVALLGLALAAWFSARLALADARFRRQSPESVERAMRLLPRNTEYLSYRALQLSYDGVDSSMLVERQAELNPLASAPRIRLGLIAESKGDLATAESRLLDAARVDRQFEPRWTLANFYFRQGRLDDFWPWIRSALEVSYGDRRLAFDLCWRAAQNPDEIFTRAIPAHRDVLSAYLIYLLDRRSIAQVGPVALKLAGFRDHYDAPLLHAASDALIGAQEIAPARELWRTQTGVSPEGLINGDFTHAPLDHGFDWRLLHAPGVTYLTLDAPHALRISLDGHQPETSELLGQFVNLERNRNYRLQWEARSQGFMSPSGLAWRIGDAAAALLSADDWRVGELVFRSPDDCTALTLTYTRPAGQARAEGFLELRHVRVTEASN